MGVPGRAALSTAGGGQHPTWENAFSVLDPQINAAGIHVWPFNPSFPIDVRFFVAGGAHNIRINRHAYYEIIFVWQGRTELMIQDRCFQIGPGDLVVIGGGLYHGIIGRPPVKLVTLYFEPELVSRPPAEGEDVEYLRPFFSPGAGAPHVVPAESGISEQVLDLMQRIHAELPAASVRERLSVKTYLKTILVLLVNHYAAYLGNQETLDRKQTELQRLAVLFDYLEQHYHEPIRVADAAHICTLSASHFMYFFRKATGQSFVGYLNRFRVAKAQVALVWTEQTLAEVSLATGFCDQSHFGQVFRKLVGMTPLNYRQRFSQKGLVIDETTSSSLGRGPIIPLEPMVRSNFS
jgi:AraC-like DNA-binding protein/mannose-6-phosphate isomerase-like protein (cupin superfamily)